VTIQLKFQLKIPGNKEDMKKFQITFLKNHGCRLQTLTGLTLSPRKVNFKIFFVNWAAKLGGRFYFFGQQFYFFRTAKFINGQQLLKH
jgi:hypothetical protein